MSPFPATTLIAQPKPGPTNTGALSDKTGYPAYGGPAHITADDSTVSGVAFTGTIWLDGDRITVEDCSQSAGGIIVTGDDCIIRDMFSTGGLYCVQITTGTGLLIEDCTHDQPTSAAVFGGNYTARRINVGEAEQDAFHTSDAGNILIENCWVHNLGTAPAAHADGFQVRGGSNIEARYNFWDLPSNPSPPGYAHNACILLEADTAIIDDVRIHHNWLSGGTAPIVLTYRDPITGPSPPDYGGATNCRVWSNRIDPDTYQFQSFRDDASPNTSVRWANVWDSTGTESGRTGFIQGELCSWNNATSPP